jgi:hypothetical protein
MRALSHPVVSGKSRTNRAQSGNSRPGTLHDSLMAGSVVNVGSAARTTAGGAGGRSKMNMRDTTTRPNSLAREQRAPRDGGDGHRLAVDSCLMEDFPATLDPIATAREWIAKAETTPPGKEREAMIVKAVVALAVAVGKLAPTE